MKWLSRAIVPLGCFFTATAVVFQDPLKTPLLRSVSLVAAVVVTLGVLKTSGRARTALAAADASIVVWFVTRIVRDLDSTRIEVEALGVVASMLLLGASIVLVSGRPIGWPRETELAALVPLCLGTGLAAGFLGVRQPPGIPADTSPWVAVLGWAAAGLLLAVIAVGVFDGRVHLRARRLLLLAAGLILAPALACATPQIRCTSIGWVLGHLAIAAAAFEVDIERAVRTGARGPFRRMRRYAAVAAAMAPVAVLLAVAVLGGSDGRDPMAFVGAAVVVALILFATTRSKYKLSREADAVLRDWGSGGAELDDHGAVARWDERFWTLLGAEEPHETTSMLERIDPADRRPVRGAMVGAAAGRVSVVRCRTVTGAETELVLAPGPYGPVAGLSVRPESQRQREAAHRRAEQNEQSVPHAGLVARDVFTGELARLQADVGHQPVLLFVDLDGINDVVRLMGRDAAPYVVHQLADRLVAAVPAPNLVSRLGVDELAVLMPAPTRQDVGELGVRALAALTQPVQVADQRFSLAVHLDVAVASSTPAEDVVRGVGAVLFDPAEWGYESQLPRRVPGAGVLTP